MDLAKVLVQLREELKNLDEAILTLQRIRETVERRRGEPPEAPEEEKKAGRSPGRKRVPTRRSGKDRPHSA